MDMLKKHGLTDLNDHDAFFDIFYDEDLRFDYMMAFKKLTKCLTWSTLPGKLSTIWPITRHSLRSM